ncbi:MAG: ABC transporter permease [Oscillospiraceae bacterium]|nr:ABC transporter permease [Oscillospiraceae bacterium]
MMIFKYRIKSIFRNRFQTVLLLVAVAVAATLVFTSVQVSSVMRRINEESARSQVGTSDIVIEPKVSSDEEAKEEFRPIISDTADFQYIFSVFHCHVRYQPNPESAEYFQVWGTDWEKVFEFTDLSFVGKVPEALGEKEIIISRKTSERLGYRMGDRIELDVHANEGMYTVAGICGSTGIFSDEAHIATVIMNRDLLNEIFETGGRPNAIYLKVADPAQKSHILEELYKTNKNVTVSDADQIARGSANGADSSVSFLIVSIFAVLVSAFIIYTSYHVVMAKRLPEIGTFRSVGATKKKMNAVFLLESVLIGLLGGVTGVLTGVAASSFILRQNSTERVREAASSMALHPGFIAGTLTFAVLLSLAGSFVPIEKSAGRPLRDILLSADRAPRKARLRTAMIGLSLTIVSMLAPIVVPKDMISSIVGNSILMTGSLVGIILMIPKLLEFIGGMIYRIAAATGKNAVAIGAGSLRGNKSVANNTVLVAIGLAALIFIYTLSNSLSAELNDLFREDAKFDLFVVTNNLDEEVVSEISDSPDIDSVSPVYSIKSVSVEGKDALIRSLYGIDADNYFEMWDFRLIGDRGQSILDLEQGRGILLASRIADRLNVKTGDPITIMIDDGPVRYTVAGIFETLWDSGEMALISSLNFRTDVTPSGYDSLLIRTAGDPSLVMERLKNTYLTDIRYAATHDEIEKRSSDGIIEVFSVLKTFTMIALLISVIGIANNLILSFFERKKTFAVYRSVGADRSFMRKIPVLESLFSGLVAVLSGCLGATLLLMTVPGIMAVIVGPIRIHYEIITYALFGASAIVLLMLSALYSTIKLNRARLIDSIRYE